MQACRENFGILIVQWSVLVPWKIFKHVPHEIFLKFLKPFSCISVTVQHEFFWGTKQMKWNILFVFPVFFSLFSILFLPFPYSLGEKISSFSPKRFLIVSCVNQTEKHTPLWRNWLINIQTFSHRLIKTTNRTPMFSFQALGVFHY